MRKLLVGCLAVTMMFSGLVFPVTAFAEETTDTTESTETTTTESTEIVHFDIDFEDYTETDTKLPKDDEPTAVGEWSRQLGAAGKIVEGADGKAFQVTSTANDHFRYAPLKANQIKGGKLLFSFDMTYNPKGTIVNQAWEFFYQASGNNLHRQLRMNNTADGLIVSSIGGGTSSAALNTLFTATSSDEVYTIDILIDFDNSKKYYYVNGEMQDEVDLTLTDISARSFRFFVNDYMKSIDNIRMIENPQNYSFAVKDNITIEDDYITVRFSDTVQPAASDFVITNKTDSTEAATVTEVEQVTGKIYKLKLSQKLVAGEYTISLANTGFTSVIGTTATNTTSDFTVYPARTHFSIDFEDYTVSDTVITLPKEKATGFDAGAWSYVLSNAGTVINGTDGKAFKVSGYKVNYPRYAPNTDCQVKGGKVLISLDLNYNPSSTARKVVWDFYPLASGGSALTYLTFNNNTPGSMSVISRGDTTLFTATSSDKVYTIDVILDLENDTADYYVDGVYKDTSDLGITGTLSARSFRFTASDFMNCIDNFKMIENPLPYTLSQKGTITTEDKYLTVKFSDTVNATASDFVITNKTDGREAATVTEVQRVTGGIYKLKLDKMLAEGEYNVGLTNIYLTSVIGTKAANTTASFTVEKGEFTATSLTFAEDGTLSVTIKNTAAGEKTAFMIIAAYSGDKMVDCAIQKVPVPAGTEALEQTLTLTSEKDLSDCVIRGYIWENEDYYPLYETITK